MQNYIIGREKERKILDEMYNSDVSEFVAVYGRRRVGKTFLIREVFSEQLVFDVAGLSKADTKEQLIKLPSSKPKLKHGKQYTC